MAATALLRLCPAAHAASASFCDPELGSRANGAAAHVAAVSWWRQGHSRAALSHTRRASTPNFIVCNVADTPRTTDTTADGDELQQAGKKKRGRKPKSKTAPVVTPSAEPLQSQETLSQQDVKGEDEDIELEKGYKMSRVCDKLIDVFMVDRPQPDEWRKLLAFSEEWSKIRPHFYKRCKARADTEEDPKKKGDLLKLSRRLKEVDDDMMRHDELIAEIEGNAAELDAIVARRRKDFTAEFFQHLKTLCEAAYRNLNRREELQALATKILTFVQAYDHAAEDEHAIKVAQMKLDDILNSPSLEAASKKIDQLAKKQELDSTLMLMITKAWAAAKESTMMKDEVKDIMYHLYLVARGNMQRLVPKEVRIIRHILSIEDPRERMAALTNAFSPGDELEGKDSDTLYTKPDRLLKWVQIVLDAYKTQQQGTLIKEAQSLMNPAVIVRLETLKQMLENEFM